MELDKLISEMDDEMAGPEEGEGEAKEVKVYVDSSSRFKARVKWPTKMVDFKYKDLAEAFKNAGVPITSPLKAKDAFSAVRSVMGL